MSARDLLSSASSGSSGSTYVDDVFSTYLYTGNGSTQTITNGIDLAGKGGLVWIKQRGGATNHLLYDTERGSGHNLSSNTTGGQGSGFGLSSFNADGFAGSDGFDFNVNAGTFSSWTFRKAPKFFDVVTYTGNGIRRTVNHSLGQVPGMIIVKAYSGGGSSTMGWPVYHRSLGATKGLSLDTTGAAYTSTAAWGDTEPTSTQFTVDTGAAFNENGTLYVAYLFAHDPSADGIIQCGSYVGNGSLNGPVINLGWEPQFLLIKAATDLQGWSLRDGMRGMPVTGTAARLLANTTTAEAATSPTGTSPMPTGFKVVSTDDEVNKSTHTYIYLAIRRPNKPPTTGTQVYTGISSGATTGTSQSTGFAVDTQILTPRAGGTGSIWHDRLRGVSTTATASSVPYLKSSVTSAEASSAVNAHLWNNEGFAIAPNWSGVSTMYHNFRRAPGVFSILCDTGTGSAHAIDHNLGSVPELIIRKGRSGATQWEVYFASLGNTKKLVLNSTAAEATDATAWNSTTPTSTQITVGTGANVNTSSATYVTYLFATLPGISKVGSYTGNGSSQTINCGFSTGARFFMCKAVSTTGNWIVADSARGIVSANDPALYMNSTAAEVTSADWCDPDNLGIIVNQEGTMNANTNGVEYIYLAIA